MRKRLKGRISSETERIHYARAGKREETENWSQRGEQLKPPGRFRLIESRKGVAPDPIIATRLFLRKHRLIRFR